jgi:rhodanese-related sulfurtransferase
MQQSPKFLKLVTDAKKQIKEISPQILKEKIDNNNPLCLIDVREASEWAQGHIPGAIHISRGVIEFQIEKNIPDTETEVVVYCAAGLRCALVAANLKAMGYTKVYSLETGIQGWVNAGYEIEA